MILVLALGSNLIDYNYEKKKKKILLISKLENLFCLILVLAMRPSTFQYTNSVEIFSAKDLQTLWDR